MTKRKRKSTLVGAKLAAISMARAVTRPNEAAASDSDDNLIPAPRIRKLCGHVSHMTLWRWVRSEKLGCPPLTEINGRLYGSERAWLAWRENQRRLQATAP
jgi:hypothetical protein